MRNRGKIAVLGWAIAKFFPVAELCLGQTMNAPARLGGFDDGRYIEGVAIHGYAPFDPSKGKAFSFQVAFVNRNKCGKLGPRGMPHEEYSVRITSVFADMLMHEADRLGDIGKYRLDRDGRQGRRVGRTPDP